MPRKRMALMLERAGWALNSASTLMFRWADRLYPGVAIRMMGGDPDDAA